jgi:hypothetical protein
MNNSATILSIVIASISLGGAILTIIHAFRIAKKSAKEKIKLIKEQHYWVSGDIKGHSPAK